MKTTKTEIKRQLKRLWNNTMIVKSLNGKECRVGRTCWHHLQYKIIPMSANFSHISDREKCNSLKEFYYKQELVDHLYQEFNQ